MTSGPSRPRPRDRAATRRSITCLGTGLILGLIGLLACGGLAPLAVAAESPTYDDPFYKQKLAGGLANTFYEVVERVDPFTGNLNLTHTDVVLPGNGGLDLRIQRSYNSRIWGRTDVSFPGLVAINELSVMGIGWSFHFGRVSNPHGTGSSNRFLPDNPVVEMPDGSVHPLYRDKADTTRFISREYWRYRQSSGVTTEFELTLTDGTVYTFPASTGYYTPDKVLIYQVGTIRTTNGNTITFTYNATNPRLLTSVTDSTDRVLTFGYTTVPLILSGSDTVLTSMTVNGRTYTYRYVTIDSKLFLAEVVPPVGPSWRYTYYPNEPALQRYELRSVTYPTGAVLTYAYSDVWFDVGATAVKFRVVTSRTLSGRGLTATTWNYSYVANAAANQVTTVTQSGCRTERYTYASFGALPNSGLVNTVWQVGLLLKKELLNGPTVVQTESYSWSPSASISTNDISNGDWSGTLGFIYDDQIFVPQLSSRVISRGGAEPVNENETPGLRIY